MIIFLIVLLCLGYILEQISLNNNLDAVRYQCTPSVRGCEPGEIFRIQSVITNTGKGFIPYLKISENLPPMIDIVGKKSLMLYTKDNYLVHQSIVFISSRQIVRRTISASIENRGEYFFGGCLLRKGDFLGLLEPRRNVVRTEEQNYGIIIYPKKIEDEKFNSALSNFYGDISAKQFLIVDPIFIMGYRDYTGIEPQKSISFIQSAKRNKLTVKEFDHTQEFSITVVLDLSYKNDFNYVKVRRECCFSLTRSVCEFFEIKNVPYRLVTNALIPGKDREISSFLSLGQGRHNFEIILEALGKSSVGVICNTKTLINKVCSNSFQNGAVIYISTAEDENTVADMRALKGKSNMSVYPFYASDYAKEEITC